jgi:hypothetical protein
MGWKKGKFGEVRIFNDELNCKFLYVESVAEATCFYVTEAFL